MSLLDKTFLSIVFDCVWHVSLMIIVCLPTLYFDMWPPCKLTLLYPLLETVMLTKIQVSLFIVFASKVSSAEKKIPSTLQSDGNQILCRYILLDRKLRRDALLLTKSTPPTSILLPNVFTRWSRMTSKEGIGNKSAVDLEGVSCCTSSLDMKVMQRPKREEVGEEDRKED